MASVATNTNELEKKLALLAFQFRQASADPSRCRTIANEYEIVFDDLVRTAGHFVEPHFDSLLPDGYMPRQYELRKAQIARGEFQACSGTKNKPFKTLVFRIYGTLKPIRDIFARDQ